MFVLRLFLMMFRRLFHRSTLALICIGAFQASVMAMLVPTEGVVLEPESGPPCAPMQLSTVVMNAGASRLEIVTIEPTCGCSKAEVDSRVLEPGETTTLRMEINPLRTATGELSEGVTLMDDGGGEIRFQIRGMVVPCAAFDTSVMDLGVIDLDAHTPEVLERKIVAEPGVTLGEIAATSESSELGNITVQQGASEAVVRFELRPAGTLGLHEARLRVTMDGLAFNEVPVAWQAVSGRLELDPNPLHLGAVRQRARREASLTIRLPREGDRLVEVVSEAEDFTIHRQPELPAAAEAEVVVLFHPQSRGRFTGHLKLGVADASGTVTHYRVPVAGIGI